MANTPGKKATAGPTGAAKPRSAGARKPKKAPEAAPTPAQADASGEGLAESAAGTQPSGGAVATETIVVDDPVQAAATIVTEPAIEPVAPNPAAPAPAAAGQPAQAVPEAEPPTYRPAPAPWALIVGLGGLVWATLIGLMVIGVATPGTITFNPAWLLVALGVLIVGFGFAGLVSSQRRRA